MNGFNRIAATLRKESTAQNSPAARSRNSGPLEDHNRWLRSLRDDYNDRVSRASACSTEGSRRSGADSESDGVFSGRWGDELDMYRGLGEDTFGQPAEYIDDEYTEELVYRGMSLDQPSGDDAVSHAQCENPVEFCDNPVAQVNRSWLRANPPLIRRQSAFGQEGQRPFP